MSTEVQRSIACLKGPNPKGATTDIGRAGCDGKRDDGTGIGNSNPANTASRRKIRSWDRTCFSAASRSGRLWKFPGSGESLSPAVVGGLRRRSGSFSNRSRGPRVLGYSASHGT